MRSLAISGFTAVGAFSGGAVVRVAGVGSYPTFAYIDTTEPGGVSFFSTSTAATSIANNDLSNVSDDLRVVGFIYPAFGNS
jgi:hypothetical protein